MTITRNPEVGKAAASPVPPPVAPELSRRGFLGTALAGGLSAAIAPLIRTTRRRRIARRIGTAGGAICRTFGGPAAGYGPKQHRDAGSV